MGLKTPTGLAIALLAAAVACGGASRGSGPSPKCRYLPGDAQWPSPSTWNQLNTTVGGRLIAGRPLARSCYNPGVNPAQCAAIKAEWTELDPFLEDPVNVVAPYWQNNTCSPFLGPNGPCALGNLASYAIRVSTPQDAIAGVNFANANNIRLTIKNTGHDFLGRSAGAGSLVLWTHNLKEITFLKSFKTLGYTGPAVRLGAGVQGSDVLPAAKAAGYRVVSGSCPTVGPTGGFTQGGGHSPLSAKYGLAADQVLEFEVVTAAGQHTTASPTKNIDLFWALRGGGGGNYAVVLSMTVKAHKDGPVAGAGFVLLNDGDSDKYWAAITAWLKHLLVLDKIDGYLTGWTITAQAFFLAFAALPDATSVNDITGPLAPFFAELNRLNVTLAQNGAALSSNYADWFATWAGTVEYTTNNALGGRLIPRTVVQRDLTSLVNVFRDIVEISSPEVGGSALNGISLNVSTSRIGLAGIPGANAVLPAWRDALFTLNFGIPFAPDAAWPALKFGQAWINDKQTKLRNVTPGGGTYMNEATFDNPNWKQDYFGANYIPLLAIKAKYDPNGLFWAHAAVGSDLHWRAQADGRLCRPSGFSRN
ncbi:hypothetical protein QBC35DRAFT_505668 [Podospora australis]|uniref:FAD-binding PCMH-type domain-containing protein n=1 Tax=Podospora australis TaxID=1536484 RepID=A0AAN6WQI6_9PEZI|nr:hypothetical protein QBC35DRAFT_505668 [Podospora australis]